MLEITVRGAEELCAQIPVSAEALQHKELPAAVEKIAANGAVRAKWMIGRERAPWKPLAASTVREKRRLGYAGRLLATDPLLRAGGMKRSIRTASDRLTASLNAPDEVALYQDQGTEVGGKTHIPARHFVLPALELVAARGMKLLIAAWDSVWR